MKLSRIRGVACRSPGAVRAQGPWRSVSFPSRSGIWWQSPLSGADGSRDETGATEVSGASTMSPTTVFS
jgi:hypothetical protein